MKKELREKINGQLKVLPLVTSQKYHRIVRNYDVESLIANVYWRMIPEYIISRCPICLTPYQQTLDTYSLWLWHIRHDMNSVTYSAKGYKRCKHYLGVHTFLNLNGHKPKASELNSGHLFSSEPEIPMITPTLLPRDIQSYAVLHSLPICKIWGGRFIPKYTLYMLTYYSINNQELELRRLKEWTRGIDLEVRLGKTWGYGYKRLGIYWEETKKKQQAWDLRYWVEQGKLFWLDLTSPDLVLMNDRVQFPYKNIEGVHHGYKYKDNQYEIVNTKPTIEEYIQRYYS